MKSTNLEKSKVIFLNEFDELKDSIRKMSYFVLVKNSK